MNFNPEIRGEKFYTNAAWEGNTTTRFQCTTLSFSCFSGLNRVRWASSPWEWSSRVGFQCCAWAVPWDRRQDRHRRRRSEFSGRSTRSTWRAPCRWASDRSRDGADATASRCAWAGWPAASACVPATWLSRTPAAARGSWCRWAAPPLRLEQNRATGLLVRVTAHRVSSSFDFHASVKRPVWTIIESEIHQTGG